MTYPIEIVTDLLRVQTHNAARALAPHEAAYVAVGVLTDERIVGNAVKALLDDGWRHTHEGPHGAGELSDEDLANIALTVLRSVGGGQ